MNERNRFRECRHLYRFVYDLYHANRIEENVKYCFVVECFERVNESINKKQTNRYNVMFAVHRALLTVSLCHDLYYYENERWTV